MDSEEKVLLGRLDTTIGSVKETLSSFKKENREDHQKLFDKLSTINTRVTVVEGVANNNTKKIVTHESNHWKAMGLLCTAGGILVGVLTWAITSFFIT